jgi:hypothetical protein
MNHRNEILCQQVDLVIASDTLGRTQALDRLLAYLRDTALEGRAPKAAEIAREVFARNDGGEGEGMVRVAMHRLRGKLTEFYASEGRECAWRLVLPRGSYMLRVAASHELIPQPQPQPQPTPEPEPQSETAHRASGWRVLAPLALALCVISGFAGWRVAQDRDPNVALRHDPMWASVLGHGHKATLVLGDYYIFAERDKDGEIERLIRDFTINSRDDLDMLKSAVAPGAQNYVDIGLNYLPAGLGSAIRDIGPLVGRGPVVTASQLTVRTLQGEDIVYLGYLSGLGELGTAGFDGAPFKVGANFDEIIDSKTGKHYVASSHLERNDFLGEDYAIITGFAGPNGHHILLIAGTRDAALMGAARFASDPALLRQLAPFSSGAFEALVAVSAIQNAGLQSRLIAVTKRPDPSWMEPGRL